MQIIKERFVRIRELAEICGIDRQKRIQQKRNGSWELVNWLKKIVRRWNNIGFKHDAKFIKLNSDKSDIDRYAVDEQTAHLVLLTRGFSPKNVSEETKKKFIEYLKISEKANKVLKGKLGRFIKGNAIKIRV